MLPPGAELSVSEALASSPRSVASGPLIDTGSVSEPLPVRFGPLKSLASEDGLASRSLSRSGL